MIGQGSFSKVYKGYDTKNQLIVAVKEIDINKCDSKFKEEVRLT